MRRWAMAVRVRSVGVGPSPHQGAVVVQKSKRCHNECQTEAEIKQRNEPTRHERREPQPNADAHHGDDDQIALGVKCGPDGGTVSGEILDALRVAFDDGRKNHAREQDPDCGG